MSKDTKREESCYNCGARVPPPIKEGWANFCSAECEREWYGREPTPLKDMMATVEMADRDRVLASALMAETMRSTEMSNSEPQQTSAQHTPGPWHVGSDGPDPDIYDAEGYCVVYQVCSGAHDENDDGRTNAALIAAAPDLLAALEAITKTHADACGFSDWEPATDVIERARAAIAKARGEQV